MFALCLFLEMDKLENMHPVTSTLGNGLRNYWPGHTLPMTSASNPNRLIQGGSVGNLHQDDAGLALSPLRYMAEPTSIGGAENDDKTSVLCSKMPQGHFYRP